MNRTERIYRIHGLLRGKTPISALRLAQETEMHVSSIKRDIQYMRDFMNAPILYDRADNRYYYDPNAPEFELPGLWFNASELYALLATEQLLESVQPGFLSPSLGPLKGRIRKLLHESGQSADTVAARVKLQPMANRTVDDHIFTHIAGATLQGQQISIFYHGREKNTATDRVVHPCLLLHYRHNWYLIAHCNNANDLRTFSLDRISKPKLTGQTAQDFDAKKLERYLSASFGIFTGEAKHWAVLRFSADASRWVADEHWHPDQLGHWHGKEFELQVPYSDARELVMEILKYGPEVEVIAPPELRTAVGDRLRNAAEKYFGESEQRSVI